MAANQLLGVQVKNLSIIHRKKTDSGATAMMVVEKQKMSVIVLWLMGEQRAEMAFCLTEVMNVGSVKVLMLIQIKLKQENVMI